MYFMMAFRLPWRARAASDGWTRCVDGTQADVLAKRICAIVSQVSDIHEIVGGVIDRNLYGGVPDYHISPEYISLNPRGHKYPGRISNNRVFLNHVPGIGSGNETDTEVASLRHDSISTDPVPTEPVTASAAGHSYAAAWIGSIAVSY